MNQPKFKIGDRVTYESPVLLYKKKRGVGKVVSETSEHYYIIWEDEPKMVCPHLKVILVEPSNKLIKAKKNQPTKTLRSDVKLGDRVRNLDTKVEGKITHLSDRCITIKSEEAIESHNLLLATPKLEILENYAAQFKIRDRVVMLKKYPHNSIKFKKIGIIQKIADDYVHIFWDEYNAVAQHSIKDINEYKWLGLAPKSDLPENTSKHAPDRHGYFEHYSVTGTNDREYYYTRYLYKEISGKLLHHHVPNKQSESINALWRSGATAKEICIAIGKQYLGENST